MNVSTEKAVIAILSADATISADTARRAIMLLRGRLDREAEKQTPDSLLSREDVAAILGVSTKSVDIYSRKGILRRVYMGEHGTPGRRRALGISKRSLVDAMNKGLANGRDNTATENA